jgi:DNA-directed RNA polymerase subunit alpha
MRIRWRNFELPSSVKVEKESLSEDYGKFFIEPFERGFGHSIGNGLRRVLLSSIEGYAITSVKIDGVLHEFTTIPGVLEDVTDIILNLKRILVKGYGPGPIRMSVDASGDGPVTGAAIQSDENSEIINKDALIATITDKDAKLQMDIEARLGRAYVTSEDNEIEDHELGVISMDSNFSPVKRVRYRVEDTRVGKITNYDKLILEIWTDGTISPEMALIEASKIYRKHLNPFVHYNRMSRDVPLEEVKEKEEVAEEERRSHIKDILTKSIDELDLSVRAKNCLDAVNLNNIGELVQQSESELLKVRNFGKTSLKEIKKKLADLNLSLGMELEQIN